MSGQMITLEDYGSRILSASIPLVYGKLLSELSALPPQPPVALLIRICWAWDELIERACRARAIIETAIDPLSPDPWDY